MSRTSFLKPFIFVSICILLLTASTAMAGENAPEQLKAMDNAGKQLVKQGNYSEGIEKFQQIIRDYPSTSYAMDAQLEIAAVRIRTNDTVGADAAVQQLLNAYADQPDVARCVRIISWEYIKANQPDKVIQLCQQGLSRWPEHSEAFNLRRNLAVAYVLLGEDAQAGAATAKLLSDYPENAGLAKSLRMIAEAYYETKRYDKTTALLLQLMRSWPTHKEGPVAIKHLRDMTIHYIRESNYQQADMIIAGLLTSQSSSSSRIGEYACRIAKTYFAKQEYKKAKRVCQQVLKDWPDCSERHKTVWTLLSCLIELGEYDQAVQVATEAIKHSGDYDHSSRYRLVAHEALADMYARTGKAVLAEKEAAMADAEREGLVQEYVQEPAPAAILELAGAYYDRAMIELQFGHDERANTGFRKAIAVLQEIISRPPKDKHALMSRVFYALGLNLQGLQDYTEAAGAYARSYQQDPQFEYADYCLFAQGYCFEMLMVEGKIQRADAKTMIVTQYQEVISKFPESNYAKNAQEWLDENLQ